MMCQCRFTNCNKGTTLVGDVDSGGGSVCIGAVGIWEISIPSPQFCCESKIALQNKLFFFKSVYKNELHFYMAVKIEVLNSVIYH